MPTRNIKLTIEYDGTHFKGWQIQAQHERTVQDELEKTLQTIFKKKIRLVGSGRTDSGVHALGQIANFKVPSQMSSCEILKALNANLPDDIVIHNAEEVPAKFHAQYSAKRKTYRYSILNRDLPSAQGRFYCLHFPQQLNLRIMRSAAKALTGRKDFRSFMASDPAKAKRGLGKNTIRRIYKLEIRKKGDYIQIDIEADGFLYKMVRNIVGTLLKVGTGRLHPKTTQEILRKKNRVFAAETAPAKGLCLLRVRY